MKKKLDDGYGNTVDKDDNPLTGWTKYGKYRIKAWSQEYIFTYTKGTWCNDLDTIEVEWTNTCDKWDHNANYMKGSMEHISFNNIGGILDSKDLHYLDIHQLRYRHSQVCANNILNGTFPGYTCLLDGTNKNVTIEEIN